MSLPSAAFFLLLLTALAAYRYTPSHARFLFGCSPSGARILVLAAANAVFYAAAGLRYLPLLGAAALVSFLGRLALARLAAPGARRAVLAAVLCLLFGTLCFFKYGGAAGVRRAMPLGLSFITFTLAGYPIDQYRRRYAPEKNFLRFFAFASFFPLVSAGPIERGDGLLRQMSAPPAPDYGTFCEGASRILWGFFKKFVVADTIGTMTGRVFAAPEAWAGPYLALAALLYTYELYCDFAGYSDIAVGAARMFGFSVRENFRRPFAARSFRELWRRWHISLTGWLRDYLYIPLGGSRKGAVRTVCNTLLVFLVSGIWHGAGATYAVWGLLNGLFLSFGRVRAAMRARRAPETPPARCPRLRAAGQCAAVYLLFAAGLLFFRAPSLAAAGTFCAHLFTGWETLADVPGVIAALKGMNIGRVTGLLTLGGAGLVETVEWRADRAGVSAGVWMRRLGPMRRLALYYALALLLLCFGALGTSSFIYFAF